MLQEEIQSGFTKQNNSILGADALTSARNNIAKSASWGVLKARHKILAYCIVQQLSELEILVVISSNDQSTMPSTENK